MLRSMRLCRVRAVRKLVRTGSLVRASFINNLSVYY